MKIFTVWELTRYLKNLLHRDPELQSLWVKGEISDFRRPTSGHMYFNLKDQGASLRCVMFRGKNQSLDFDPDSGDAVVVRGSMSLYEKSGIYQLYVEEMLPAGAGDLNQALLRLKEKLAAEGLFDAARKKPLPLAPERIALITSPTGAALRDIITTVKRRSPATKLLVVPVAVQGSGSAAEIALAIELVNACKNCDLIIVARGGGSLEELWSFNEEVVARSIFASEIPVISAVGHETDFTIADFVADIRAATPTAAAEIAVPHRRDYVQKVNHLEQRLTAIMQRSMAHEKRYLEKLTAARVLRLPEELTRRHHLSLDQYWEQLQKGMQQSLAACHDKLALAGAKLDGTSPLKTLARGYALVEDGEGRPLTRAASLALQALIRLRFQDGSAVCEVKEVEDNRGEA
jgi:exodeoxyribonuclease VII large subunit